MFKKVITGISLFTILLQPMTAFAGHPPSHRRPGHGFPGPGHREVIVHRMPPGYVSLLVAGLTYLYCEGLFYRYTTRGYAVVEPPVGAVVPVLPAGYTTVIMNGSPYYMYGYTYYVPSPHGYVVVNPPMIQQVPAVTPAVVGPVAPPPVTTPATTAVAVPSSTGISTASSAVSTGKSSEEKPDVFEIYIPNGNGSFTMVSLRQTEKGFLGPQGEFYADHPTVEELKSRYTKN